MMPAPTAAAISAEREEICLAVSSGNGAIPPTRWQPVHFSRTIGATSRVKLGSADGAAARFVTARATSGTASASSAASTRASLVVRRLRALRVIGAPELAQRAAELADRALRAERLPERGQEVLVRLGDPAHLRQGRLCGRRVPIRADALGARALAPLALRVDLEELPDEDLTRLEAEFRKLREQTRANAQPAGSGRG